MKALILGAGYVGKELAKILFTRGYDVTGWVLSQASVTKLKEYSIHPICANLTDESAWKDIAKEWDAVVFCASSSRGGIEAYRSIHETALDHALKLKAPKWIYTSSTSVYGQTDGSVVTETSLTQPQSETSNILLEAEEKILHAGGCIARVSGIYGPGRAVHFQKIMDGTATIDGDGKRWLNQIHRTDVAEALAFLIGQDDISAQIYNVTDDEPMQLHPFYEWLCAAHSKPLPPTVPPPLKRKRGATNKRVSNTKIKSLGWKLQYPTYRHGYHAI